jgi:hypothetical protein
MKEAILAIFLIVMLISLSTCEDSGERVYDCGMAEWHPDIPPKVKEECRRRALEYWREEQRKKTI